MAGSSSAKNAVPRRTYRERQQAGRRLLRFPFLEKKKDWQLRSRRWKARQQLLQHLAEKARCRNEEEFAFRMLKAKQVGGGVDGLGGKKTSGGTYLLTADQAAVSSSSCSSQLVSAAAQQKVERRRHRAAAEQQQLQQNLRFLQHKQQVLRRRMQKTVAGAAAAVYCASSSSSHTAVAALDAEDNDTPRDDSDETSDASFLSETKKTFFDCSSEKKCRENVLSSVTLHTGSGSRGTAATATGSVDGEQHSATGEQLAGHSSRRRKAAQQQGNSVIWRQQQQQLSSDGESDHTSTEEVSDEEQQSCRWLRRRAALPTTAADSSTDDGGEEEERGSSSSGSEDGSEEEREVEKQAGKTRGTRREKREKSRKTWVEQLQDDCEHVKRVKGLLSKLQLQRDLHSKGRRTKVADAVSSRSVPVYKWFAERKK